LQQAVRKTAFIKYVKSGKCGSAEALCVAEISRQQNAVNIWSLLTVSSAFGHCAAAQLATATLGFFQDYICINLYPRHSFRAQKYNNNDIMTMNNMETSVFFPFLSSPNGFYMAGYKPWYIATIFALLFQGIGFRKRHWRDIKSC
jgi:hypothetical protein